MRTASALPTLAHVISGVSPVPIGVFGLAPALQTARQSSWGNLTESSRGTTPGARSHRLRGLLVISEVALALVALTGAGLFLHSFQRARTMDPGFQTANVLLATLNLSEQGYTREQGKLFLRRARERIEAIPGVKVASFAEDVPLGFDADGLPLSVQVIGRRGADALTIAVAGALEQDFGGWHRANPSWRVREARAHTQVHAH